MAGVFISYASEDSDFAELAQSRLQAAGIEVWLDQGKLHPGDDWRAGIEAGLTAAEVLIVVLSQASTSSAYVTFEWAYAMGHGVRVIPVRLHPGEVHPRLQGLHVLDFTQPRLRPWDDLIAEVRPVDPDAPRRARAKELDAVFALASEAYMDRMNLAFGTTRFGGFGTLLPGLGLGDARPEDTRRVNAFGQLVSSRRTITGAEAEADLRALVAHMQGLRIQREKAARQTLMQFFDEVQGRCASIGIHLAELPFGRGSLREPWQETLDDIRALWRDSLADVAHFDRYELDAVAQFLEQHPAYPTLAEPLKADIATLLQPGRIKLDELLDGTRQKLDAAHRALAKAAGAG